MFDHLSLAVTNSQRSLAFYDAVLAPLGFKRCVSFAKGAAYGPGGRPMFWIYYKDTNLQPSEGFHLAFQAENRKAVDEFYAAAISADAKDDGKPGLRPHYHPNYYAAFAIDPDGYRIEAVCHKPE